MFNTLHYTKMLEAVGVSRDVAETHVQIFTEIMENQLATKQDQKDLRSEISEEFAAVRSEMKGGFAAVQGEFAAVRSEMKEMGYQLTIRMGVISASLATFVIAALTLLLPIVLHVK